MKMEQSQSQTQEQKKTHSTPIHNQAQLYKHPLANAVHDSQQAFGLAKYGIALQDVTDGKYDWQLMALEESIDMNQYLTKETKRLRGEVEYWKNLEEATRNRMQEEIKQLKHYINSIEGAAHGPSD